MIELFPDQQEALNRVLERYKKMPVGGRALVVAPTGWGKTILFSSVIHALKNDKPILVIAHRDDLLNQARDKFRMIDPTAIIGKVGGGKHEYGCPITVASIDTISGEKHLEKLVEYGYDLVICDECFVAGTLIDGKPIEQIKAGDIVTAFDDRTGTFAQKKVVRTFKRPVGSHLYKITSGENTVVCTPNHPFYTSSGWKKAEELSGEDSILYAKTYQDSNSSNMFNVRTSIFDHNKSQKRSIQKHKQSLLLKRMQQQISESKVIRDNDKNQQKIRIRSNDNKKSNAQRRVSNKGTIYTQIHGAQATRARWEWKSRTYSTTTTSKRPWLADGIYRPYPHREKQQSSSIAHSLQDRYSQLRAFNSNRGGWKITHATSKKRARQEERFVSEWQRVDNIEIYEPGSDGTFGELCSDGNVYNFEVEDYHTYTANRFVVHNCHHLPAPKYLKVFKVLERAFWLGVTATDERLDGKSLEPLLGKAIFRMPIVEAIAKKRLCDVKAIAIRTETNLDDIGSSKNMEGETDFNQTELSLAVNTPARNKRIVEAYQEHLQGERAICFAVTIAHASAISEAFNDAGIPSACIFGDTPLEERYQIYAKFDKGEILVLTNVLVLTEGWDSPRVKGVLMARPTQSRALWIQCVGRGLRKAPGKSHCLILDLTDNSSKYRLKTQSLRRVIKDVQEGETILEALEREKLESEEREVQVRKLKEKRLQDVQIDLFEKIEWKELPNNVFLLEVGPEKHKIALTPSRSNPELYYVLLKRAPYNKPHDQAQKLTNIPTPIDWAQQEAEKAARKILAEPRGINLVDPSAPWRSRSITDGQRGMLKMYRIDIDEGMTSGQASDLISKHKDEIAKRKAEKEARKRAKQEA